MSEMYNESIKNRYLDEIENIGSRATIKYIFLASKRAEEIKGMDLYNFSKEDIELVMDNITMNSYHTARSNSNYISNYIEFCIRQGYRENNLNPLSTINKRWYSKFVDRTTKIHYSFEEFIDLLEDPQMLNGQDQCFLSLIFEGIVGERFSELKFLRFEDVNWDENTVYVKERNQYIKVSDECMKYLEKAYNQNTFYTFNSKTKEFTEKELLPSDYIFKNVKSARAVEGNEVGMNVFYSRLHSIKEVLDLQHLTPNSIKQSGMIYMASQLYERDKEIDTEQFREIGDKYNWSKVINNGYEYYNVTLMKYFINTQNLKELYDIDVNLEIRETKKR